MNALTQTNGLYTSIVTEPNGDGIYSIVVFHNDNGKIYSHTDVFRDDKQAMNKAKEFILESLEYIIYNEISLAETIALHSNLVLCKDDTDYLVTSQEGFVFGRFLTLQEVTSYCKTHNYTGFASALNALSILEGGIL